MWKLGPSVTFTVSTFPSVHSQYVPSRSQSVRSLPFTVSTFPSVHSQYVPPHLKRSLINLVILNRGVWRLSVPISRQIDTATPPSVVLSLRYRNVSDSYTEIALRRNMNGKCPSMAGGNWELYCDGDRAARLVTQMELGVVLWQWQGGTFGDTNGMKKANVAVCSEIRTKHAMQSENHVEFLSFKAGGT
jgi:hypothetical protein